MIITVLQYTILCVGDSFGTAGSYTDSSLIRNVALPHFEDDILSLNYIFSKKRTKYRLLRFHDDIC